MKKHLLSPIEIFASLNRHRELVAILARRAVRERYQGSLFGSLWAFIQPLIILALYTFFFGSVLKVKWGDGVERTADFALVFFAGLIPFNFFSECLHAAPNIILGNVSYVKRVVFPLETLSFVSVAAALFQAAVSTAAWLIIYLLGVGTPRATIFWLPLMYVPLLFLVLGVSWGFAVLGAYFRDVSQLTNLLSICVMLLSPVFYSLNSVGEPIRKIIRLNPMAGMIENMRTVLFFGQTPCWRQFLVSLLWGLSVAWIGFAAFQLTRREFADGV